MTGNDFLAACALGYEACGYDVCGNDGERLLLDELYIRYADGRDEGLTGKGSGLFSGPGIDLSSPEAWEAWFFDRTRRGGHPWEVCRGGNSTHVSLVVSRQMGCGVPTPRRRTLRRRVQRRRAIMGLLLCGG